ncbi:MAG: response regulator, partial [Gammaproteobacteria bacterium]|nr:response regulator [Gammaproteobacteria bacterium]
LGRIIRNLISNAIKYTNEGKVLIGCRRQHDKICIQIWDTGMGISSNDVEAIFEEFTRTNTTNVTGSGLGLSIARGFSQILGHDLKVSSSPGKGSCFSVTLDRVTAATMASVQQPVKATMELDELEDLTVVFIDDDPTVRSAMRDLLTDWGCRVSAVAGRVEAMATIEELDCPPDLILCDYHLHGESGLDVLTALHSTIGYTVPGIIITADKNLVTTSLSGLASTEILYKPVDATVLRHTIVNLLASYAEEA